MTRPSHRRAETAPFTVRLSPTERASVNEKAFLQGVTPSDLVRLAIEAYVPGLRVSPTVTAPLPDDEGST